MNYVKDDAVRAATIFILLLVPHLILVLVIIYKVVQSLQRHFHPEYCYRIKIKYQYFEKIWHKFTNIIGGKGKQTMDDPFVTYGTF